MKPIYCSIRNKGLTLTEVIFVIAVVAILATLSTHGWSGGLSPKAHLAQAVSNARQVNIAATGAAADGSAQDDKSKGWPADIRPNPANTGQFVQSLLDGGYLKFGDLKVLGAGSMVIKNQEKFDAAIDCGFKIFNVSDSDKSDTIFITSRNVILDENSARVDPDHPNQFKFKDKKFGFIVFHKGGDGTYYLKPENPKGFGTLPPAFPEILPSEGVVVNPKH